MVRARDEYTLGTLLLLYLLLVVVISAVGGTVPGLVAAAASFALAGWFLIPPFHTFAITSRDGLVELGVFVVVAAIVSATVEITARRRVADRERLEAHAAAARELEAVDQLRAALLASVSHDLRTPLATAKAAVSTLRQDDVDWEADARAELLASIEGAVDRLTRVITDLLDLSRLQAGAVAVHLGPVSLPEVLDRAVTAERAPAVRIGLTGSVPAVVADPALLERVVDNLVENAIRFSPPGGVVEVGAAVLRGATAEGTTDQAVGGARPARVALRVVDHGPGVPTESMGRMFVPFQRLDDREPGAHTGLGLAIAQGFAQAMGTRVVPSTTPHGGLTMTVELRVVDP
jgi:two-component system sensor histidine kinase KdpD